MKILAVDDTRTDLALLCAMLAQMGHEVLAAASGEEALDLFVKDAPDLVLMDVSMPGMGGYEAVRKMRGVAGNNWVPIVFAAALGQDDDIVQGLAAGGDDYLSKPVRPEILRAKINALWQHLRLFRQIEDQGRLLAEYRLKSEEEQQTAQEFMHRLLALDKIDDPLVRFHLRPAEIFSGDLIAAARTPAGHLYVMLADSTGHGLTAALAVVPVLNSFRAMAAKGFGLSAVAAEINRKIGEYLPSNRFVAAVMLALDAENGRVNVWNGGCPPAVLIDRQHGMEICQFESRHLPLGILKPDQFSDEVMTYHYGSRPCQVLMCSDGMVESADAKSMAHGLSHCLAFLSTFEAQDRLPALVELVDRRLAGGAACDDIAVILVDCPVAHPEEEVAAPQNPEFMRIMAEAPEGIEQRMGSPVKGIEWEMAFSLTAPQLRRADIVPALLQMVSQFEHGLAENLSGQLFLVLSELFNNALDHGLLGLDSALKDDTAGMDRYFEARAERLNGLERGEIRIKLAKILTPHDPCLKITVTDSGRGFDYRGLQNDARDAGLHRHGRGIELVAGVAGLLHFADGGRVAQVCLPLLHDDQCVKAACKPVADPAKPRSGG